MYPGVAYSAIVVPDDTEEISDVDRQQLLDVLCCFYNFDGNRPKAAGALRDVWEKVVEKQTEDREVLAAVLAAAAAAAAEHGLVA